MLERMEIGEHVNQDEQGELKEKVEATLTKLRELRERVAELKRRCEEFREMEAQRLEKPEKLRCDKCGHALDSEDGVVIKDANGEAKSHYHKACFQALFK
jgi:predicted nuclease with TOPRIM domain